MINPSTFEHTSALDEPVEPLDPSRLQRHPLMTRVSWILVALALVATGFIGGAKVRAHNASTGTGGFSPPAGFTPPAGFDPTQLRAGLTGGGGGAANAGTANAGANAQATTGAATSTSGAFAGTIALINNGKIYVKTADGKTTAVATSSGTAVVLGSPGTVNDLHVGDEVLVAGAADADGVVGATAIARTHTANVVATTTR
jgi:hypothetical protein